jgi:periplasmic protein TonB
MQETPDLRPPPEHSSQILNLRSDAPVGGSLTFQSSHSSVRIGASILSHLAMLLVAVIAMRYSPVAKSLDIPDERPPASIVWLAEPGPGGGGGGGGNKAPEPPKKAELPGREKVTVPVQRPPAPKPEPPKEEPPPPPLESLNIPARTMASAEMTLPGAIESQSVSATSQGAGTGGGAGTGQGTGIGSGQGSGLGPGHGGGTGGGAYRPGSGVTIPRVLREVKPQYTAEAMRAKVQGTVLLECIVMPDGNVGQVRVTRSLDGVFGLDQEAIKAAQQWKFVPGTKEGEPVPVIVTIELTFTLR